VSDITELEEKVSGLLSREGIREAFDNYALGMDLRDINRFLSAWHEDATFVQDNPKGEFQGWQGLTSWVEAVWSGYSSTNHLVGNVAIDFKSADVATATGGCVGLLVLADGRYQPGGAHYFDRYERRDGVWRIAYRKCWVSHLAIIPGAELLGFNRDIATERAILSGDQRGEFVDVRR
jgi:gamma-hexachlorocyclohexane dehydrochlorinase